MLNPSVLARDERLTVDRRRASFSDIGMTTPSPLSPRRENRGAEAEVSQFSSGLREVAGKLELEVLGCVRVFSALVEGAVEGLRTWRGLRPSEGGVGFATELLPIARAQAGTTGTTGTGEELSVKSERDDDVESFRGRGVAAEETSE